MTVSILQSNYIPWVGYFGLIAQSDVFVIYDEVQYTKNDWRNRNIIKSATGPLWLTIPVRQQSLSQKIYETTITDNRWSKKHLNSLNLNYTKAAHYNEMKEWVAGLYEVDSNYLSNVNLHFIKSICHKLGIATRIIDSRELDLTGDRVERLVNACKKLGATTYLSGPSAKNYLNVEAFEKEGMSVAWMDYSIYKPYTQIHPPFTQAVSILDVFYNLGPASGEYVVKGSTT